MPIAAYYEEVATGGMSAKEAAELKRVLVELYHNIDRLEQEVEAGLITVAPPARPKEARDERAETRGKASLPRGKTSRK